MHVCPSCTNKALRRRAANLPRNVRRREKDSIHDPYVCDNCDATFTEEDVPHIAEEDDGGEYVNPIDW